MSEEISNYSQFWTFYLTQHSNRTCRRLHFLGALSGLIIFSLGVYEARLGLVLASFVVGYACAWIGHFGFEKNIPATFKYPLWSFLSEFKLFGLMLSGKFWS